MAAPTIPNRRLPRPLPEDITTNILAQSISAPVCALALLCPEWGVCGHPRPDLQNIIRATRVDTYTLPLDPPTTTTTTEPHGTISTAFSHTERDHIFLPVMRDPREVYNIPTTTTTVAAHQNNDDEEEGPQLPRNLQRSLIQHWISATALVVSSQRPPAPRRLSEPGWGELDDGLPLLPYEDDVDVDVDVEMDSGGGGGGGVPRTVLRSVDGSEKAVLPFAAEREDYLFRRVRHLVVRGAVGVGVGALDEEEEEEEEEKRAMLLSRLNVRVRWDRLTRLETLFLDLRGYSTRPKTVYDGDLARLAGMLHGMRLKLLVIAGLRSWGLFPGFEPATMRDVQAGEESQIPWLWINEGFGGDLNVFKTFRGAVRPGGRLVLVDTLQREEWMDQMMADEFMSEDESMSVDESMADDAAWWFGV